VSMIDVPVMCVARFIEPRRISATPWYR